MKRFRLLLALGLLVPLGALATDCGNGLQCGPIPWSLPHLPVLNSPTPMPTVQITAVPTTTPAPTGSPAPTSAPTSTVISDLGSLSNQFATLQAVAAATDIPVMVSGTPVDPSAQLDSVASDAGTFFGYVRGFGAVNLGGLTPFITFIVVALAVVLTLKALGYMVPVIMFVFSQILKALQFVVQIIRG